MSSLGRFICRENTEQLSALERLASTQIHMSRMNMPLSDLDDMISSVFVLTMSGWFLVKITSCPVS